MNQTFYRAEIIKRFLDEKEFAEFDIQYQAMKSPTANNLPNKTFDDYLDTLSDQVLKRLMTRKKKKLNIFNF